jgi:MFS family permease
MFQNGRNSFYLFIIVLSQFAGTSLWFLGNAVIDDFAKLYSTPVNIALVTSVVQAGFIIGTLVFALFTIADRFKSTHLFFLCSIIAALFNLSIIWFAKDVFTLCVFRFFTGFFLAGIYPIGMKIASDIFSKKLGNALGFLVGALVIGTAFPHLLKAQVFQFSFTKILFASSFIAIFGGALIFFFIPASKPLASGRIKYSEFKKLFRIPAFRSAAFGYFGHMWELYAFWAFVPLAIQLHNTLYKPQLDIPFWSFFIIGIGAVSCVIGGILSKKWGSLKVASVSLFASGACCLLSPVLLTATPLLFLLFLFTWSFFVIADSPQFSALVAQSVPAELKGTALTFVTSIGFGITIISIQLLQKFISSFGPNGFWLLAPGPLFGLYFLLKKKFINRSSKMVRTI